MEAGLRTGNIRSPWPEEFNRRITGLVGRLHFAPTVEAMENLLAEKVPPAWITVTGNSVIDALLHVSRKIDEQQILRAGLESQFSMLDPAKKLLLVTGHRRENFGDGMRSICSALKILASEGKCQVVYPVHRNPNVRGPVEEILDGLDDVYLLPPQDYVSFVYLMKRAEILLTDSGGIQEEAPALGKPVLVMRDTTERPEALAAGTVRLVGTDARAIVAGVMTLLDDESEYMKMASSHNPYGDGTAAAQILEFALAYFKA